MWNVRAYTQPAFFLVPIPVATAQEIAGQYKLLSLPTDDKTLFPQGFPEGMHPVLVAGGYESDVRINNLEIDALIAGFTYIPFVDRLGDGKTPFLSPILVALNAPPPDNFLGGVVPGMY